MAVRLTWKGRQIRHVINEAVEEGLKETAREAVNHAKPLTPVLTGRLRGSLDHEEPFRRGTITSILWGSFDVPYAIFVEAGTFRRAGRFMLRRAADAIYPHLRGNISRHTKRRFRR